MSHCRERIDTGTDHAETVKENGLGLRGLQFTLDEEFDIR